MKQSNSVRCWFAAGSLFLDASPAYAQQATDLAGDEIVVTATKRHERLLDVPASVWAVKGDVLDRAQVRDFDDLVRLAPALTITKSTQPANNSINIRGIGTYAFSIAARPSVAVLVDDLPLGAQVQAFAPLLDIEQVEILRGPQTSLFGTSASAGAILITTKDPSPVATATAKATLTTDHERRLALTASGPLSATLGFRLTGALADYRGNLFNIHTGHWVGGHRDRVLRAKLRWAPTSATTLTVSSYFVDANSSCCTWAFRSVSPGVTFGRFRNYQAPQDAVLDGIVPSPGNRRISADVEPRGNGRDAGLNVKLEHRLGRHLLTWLGGIDHYRLADLQDTDGTSFDWGPDGAGVPGAVAGGSANGGDFNFRSLTQELKLASPASRRLDYLVGAYFNRVRSTRDFIRGSNDLMKDGTLTVVPPTTSSFASYYADSETSSLALYGQTTLHVARTINLVTGLRLNRDRIRYGLDDRVNGISFGRNGCRTTTPSGLVAETCDRHTSLTGRAALVYRPRPDLMMFASYDRGSKSAAYDLTSTFTTRSLVTQDGPYKGYPVADAVAAKQPVSPEKVDARQLGLKARLSRSVDLNVTLFDETLHDFQAQSRDELTRQNILNSIPKATTRGIELDGGVRFSPMASINLFAAYTDARIRRFLNAPCFPAQTLALGCDNGQQDLSSARLPQAPKWRMALVGETAHRLSDSVKAVFGGTSIWQSKTRQSLLADPQSLQKAYGVLNLSAGLETGRWRLKAFVVNALDQKFALNRSRDTNWNINPYGASSGAITDAVRWTPARDGKRYAGLESSLTF